MKRLLTPLGAGLVGAFIVLAGVIPTAIIVNQKDQTIKELQKKPEVIVVTATPTATPSATLTPTKAINKVYFKPSVTLPITIAPTK